MAFGIDWPGWSRGAKSAELALETLESYRERYRPVAGLAGMAREFDVAGPLEIVEDRVGPDPPPFGPPPRPAAGGPPLQPPSPSRSGTGGAARPSEWVAVQDVKGRGRATVAAAGGHPVAACGVRHRRSRGPRAGQEDRRAGASLPGDQYGAGEPGPRARAVPGLGRGLPPAAVPWAADHQLALGPGRGGTGGRRHDRNPSAAGTCPTRAAARSGPWSR